jgi:putative endonuclease
MHYTYILHSKSKDRYYTGTSENPAERLKKHNNKHTGFTSQASDWEMVFLKEFNSKTDALGFEREIKAWKSKNKIQELIISNNKV